MPFGSSNSAQLVYALESTAGTHPGGNGTKLRMTGESLNFNTATKTSDEINSTRQKSNLLQVGASGDGGFNFELCYGEYDPFIQGVMQGAYGTYGTAGVSATLTVTTTATTISASAGATGNSAFTNLKVGSWIKCTYSGTTQYCLVSAIASGTSLTLNAATPLSGTLASLTAQAGFTITSLPLDHASSATNTSYSFEVQHADITTYRKFSGYKVNKMSLSLQSGAIATGSFDFMGMSGTVAGSTGMGTPTASLTHEAMNGVSGLGALLEGGTVDANVKFKTLSLEVSNNLRGQDAIGTLGYVGIGTGGLDVTGNIQAYFANSTMLNKFLNNTASSLSFYIKDAAGQAYGFHMPAVKYSAGKVNAGGLDQDLMVDLSYVAYMDATLAKTLIISKM